MNTKKMWKQIQNHLQMTPEKKIRRLHERAEAAEAQLRLLRAKTDDGTVRTEAQSEALRERIAMTEAKVARRRQDIARYRECLLKRSQHKATHVGRLQKMQLSTISWAHNVKKAFSVVNVEVKARIAARADTAVGNGLIARTRRMQLRISGYTSLWISYVVTTVTIAVVSLLTLTRSVLLGVLGLLTQGIIDLVDAVINFAFLLVGLAVEGITVVVAALFLLVALPVTSIRARRQRREAAQDPSLATAAA